MAPDRMSLIRAAQERVSAAAADTLTPSDAIPRSAAEVARHIDHTLLRPDATAADIRGLCAEVRTHGFAAVCVNPFWVSLCREETAASSVAVAVVVGFPLGASLSAVKAEEAAQAIAQGATEVDMVVNVGALRGGDLAAVEDDIAAVVAIGAPAGVPVKVILETHFLTHDKKVAACVLAERAGAAYVKTSTGFTGGGATVEDVALMRFVVGERLGVKASGGIRTAESALAMLAAGATRIGSSSGVRIMDELSASGAG